MKWRFPDSKQAAEELADALEAAFVHTKSSPTTHEITALLDRYRVKTVRDTVDASFLGPVHPSDGSMAMRAIRLLADEIDKLREEQRG